MIIKNQSKLAQMLKAAAEFKFGCLDVVLEEVCILCLSVCLSGLLDSAQRALVTLPEPLVCSETFASLQRDDTFGSGGSSLSFQQRQVVGTFQLPLGN